LLSSNDSVLEGTECLSEAYQIVDNFLPASLAQNLRNAISDHFAEPHAHKRDTHQIWNYWFVPNRYTYFRTSPEKLFGSASAQLFVEALQSWSLDRLGLGDISWPYLSLYVPGCRQTLHNDAGNGRFAYVYSLTLDTRDTMGGSTIFLKDVDFLRRRLLIPSSSEQLCEFVEPRFNRLIVFDDRIVHGVERVEGSMDPLQGRFVLHGHIRESGPQVSGALSLEQMSRGIKEAVDNFLDENLASASLCHGPLVIALNIEPSGKVVSCRRVLDRVICEHTRASLQASLVKHLKSQIFPSAATPTVLTLPITFGGPLSP
jgi:hypothetical protein